ncbi:MAG: hypothetical protein ACE5I1_08700 [bacterium]
MDLTTKYLGPSLRNPLVVSPSPLNEDLANLKHMEDAGADAIELNIYFVAADPTISCSQVEKRYIRILNAVKSFISIPIAVKISPFFSSLANMARQLDKAGAKALVLFNRFYQPEIFSETFENAPRIQLSTSQDLRLPLRWIALLYDRMKCDLAATSGIHQATDVAKVLMAGANVAMLCSVLLRHGIDQITVLNRGLQRWMENHGYHSVVEMRGVLSHKFCISPTQFEREEYVRAFSNFKITER